MGSRIGESELLSLTSEVDDTRRLADGLGPLSGRRHPDGRADIGPRCPADRLDLDVFEDSLHLEATVRGVEYQGTHVLVTLAGDAVTELIVMLPEADFNAEPWKTGDRTCAHWDGADVHALAA